MWTVFWVLSSSPWFVITVIALIPTRLAFPRGLTLENRPELVWHLELLWCAGCLSWTSCLHRFPGQHRPQAETVVIIRASPNYVAIAMCQALFSALRMLIYPQLFNPQHNP